MAGHQQAGRNRAAGRCRVSSDRGFHQLHAIYREGKGSPHADIIERCARGVQHQHVAEERGGRHERQRWIGEDQMRHRRGDTGDIEIAAHEPGEFCRGLVDNSHDDLSSCRGPAERRGKRRIARKAPSTARGAIDESKRSVAHR